MLTTGLSIDELSSIVDDFAIDADRRTVPITNHREWPPVARLSDDQISALQFITFIEDHTPGYFAEYRRLFPIEEATDEYSAMWNRELHRFTVRWALDEERHAELLRRYQIHAGIADAVTLRRELIREGQKPFRLEHCEHAAAIVAYTVIQEKATQMFYRRMEQQVSLAEPLLAKILNQLGRDESRHFALFCRMLDAFVREAPEASVAATREVLSSFKMPLASTLRGYWRWAVRIADAMSYDHTEAYEHLIAVVDRALGAASESRTAGLRDLVPRLQGVR
jgi:acyl-[acyl-carrier-protein] desaturase